MYRRAPFSGKKNSLVYMVMLVLLLLSADAFAQRVQTRKSTGRGNQATGKDIAGRKLRTRDQSSARRAVYAVPQSYSGKKVRSQTPRSASRASAVRSSSTRTWKQSNQRSRVSVRPNVSQSRSRIYPARGPYVNNTSRTPKRYSRTYSNRDQVARFGSPSFKPKPKINARISPRTGSGSFTVRSKRNVYVGRSQRPIRGSGRDIAGRTLRTRDARSTRGQILAAPNPYVGRKVKKEGGYSGTFKSGYNSSTPRTQRAWRGDVAGRPLRENRSSRKVQAGKFYFKRNLSVSGQQRQRPLPGSGFRTSSRPVRAGGGPIPGKPPGMGARALEKALGKYKGTRPVKGGGGSISGRRSARFNAPLPVRTGAAGSERIGRYQGSMRKSQLTGRGSQGLNYSGNIRQKDVRGRGTQGLNYRGNLRMKDLTGRGAQGLNYAGNIKARRSDRPSASSARISNYRGSRNLSFTGIGAQGLNYSGNVRAKRPKVGGGGSISNQVRTNVKLPQKIYNTPKVGLYSGNYRAARPPKGGGSISDAKRSNDRLPQKMYNSPRVGLYSGNVRLRGSSQGPDKRISNYRGNISWNQQYGIGRQGLNYTGDRKVTKIDRRAATRLSNWKGSWELFELKPSWKDHGATFTGYTRLSRWKKDYKQTPYSLESALKKKSPSRSVFETDGLQVAIKQRDYGRKPRAPKNAMPGIKPSETLRKAGEYAGNIRLRGIGRNPLSSKKALPGKEPSSALVKAGEYAGNMRLRGIGRNPLSAKKALPGKEPSSPLQRAAAYTGSTRLAHAYRHNPNSSKKALKVIYPGKDYMRIGDYRGNIRVNRVTGKKFHPDAQFAHGRVYNEDGKRTTMTQFRLFWAKLFRKQAVQPNTVKEKERKPRYDKREKEIWKALYH